MTRAATSVAGARRHPPPALREGFALLEAAAAATALGERAAGLVSPPRKNRGVDSVQVAFARQLASPLVLACTIVACAAVTRADRFVAGRSGESARKWASSCMQTSAYSW